MTDLSAGSSAKSAAQLFRIDRIPPAFARAEQPIA
jgi:hypothetical protein